MEILLLLSAAFAAGFLVTGMIWIVKKLRKKATKTGAVSLILLGLSVVSFIVFMGFSGLSTALSTAMIFAALSVPVLLVVILIRKIRKKKRLIQWICVVLAVAITVGAYHASNVVWARKELKPEDYEVKVETEYDFVVEDGDTPIEVLTSRGVTPRSGSFSHVFDSSELSLLLDKTDVTEQDCLDAINQNKGISRKYKKYLLDFTHRLAQKYPGADLSILYHNLPTLRVEELDKMQFSIKSRSSAAYGVYRLDENVIYIPAGTEYVEGEWGFQVLIHEFCHAARNSWWKEGNVQNRIVFQTNVEGASSHVNRTILEEAMNSAFSCSLLNYYEKDIAYQLPSNYLRIMLECMDNYTLTDYMNHGDGYFLHRLDEFTGHTNYADVIWQLITLQRSDGQKDTLDIPAEEYRPIYDYICEMYYRKNITPDMDEAARKAVADELVEKAFYDVSDDYKIDREYFYTVLDSFVPAA